MKWVITYGIVCLVTFGKAQILTAYKDGSWWLVKDVSFTKLPDSYTHVGNWDLSSNTVEFISNTNYGLIDVNGKEVLPTIYTSIESLGHGLYYVVSDTVGLLFDVIKKQPLVENVQKVDELNRDYSFVEFNDSLISLIHLPSRTIHNFHDSCRIAGNHFNTILTQESDSVWTIYTTEGIKIVLDDPDFAYNSGYIKFGEADGETVITAKFNRKFPKVGMVSVSGNLISYHDGKLAYLYDSEENRILQSGNFDKITKTYFGGYNVERASKKGWMDEGGVIRIPIQYDAIDKFNDNYSVRNGNLQGQYDVNFKLIIPVEFFSFYKQGDFLLTSTVLGYQGLYSLKSGKTILKSIHNRIDLKQNLIKGYYGQNIRILEINENHSIKQDILLPNAITVKQELFSPFDEDFVYDQRLLNLGWFYMKNENLDSLGNVIGNKYRWGLKNASDSILIEPKLVMPLFMAKQPFSLVKTGKGKYKSIINTEEQNVFLGMRNFTTGRAFGNELILEMDSLDCMNRAYVRYETTKGYRILLPDNSVKKVVYVSSSYNKYIPYCLDGKRTFVEESDVSVRISHFSLNGKQHNTLSYVSSTKTPIFSQEFEGGKWNYLDSNGLDLFEKPFDFAQEFKYDRAIVKRGENWGVISSDTTIIPLKYAEILRVKNFNDTIFRVKVNHNGKYLLDSTLSLIANKGTVLKSEGDLSILKNGNEYSVYRNERIENTSTSAAILLGYNSYSLREKKTYLLFDAEGKEIGQVEFKPKELISENCLLIAAKNDLGLSTEDGEIIVEPGKFEFERIGNFIYQTFKEGTIVRNLEGKELIQFDQKYFVYKDPYSELITVELKGKILRFNVQGEKQAKFKLEVEEPSKLLFSNVFFGKNAIQTKDTFISIGKEYTYELYDGGYFSISNSENLISIYRYDLNNKVAEVNTRRIKEIGTGIFSYYSSDGITLISENFQKNIGVKASIIADFKDGFCLIKEGKDYYFLNEQFENPFHRKFLDAQAFHGGYASIKVKEGWTIIDVNGKQKSYPSFNAITQKGIALFETNQKPTYGLYDNHGNMIVPEIFEKIEFITDAIIKVYKTGEIGYYSISGKPLFELDKDSLTERK